MFFRNQSVTERRFPGVSRNAALESFWCDDNPGRNGIFEVTFWPGSKLTAWNDSWEYDGQTVTVEYTGYHLAAGMSSGMGWMVIPPDSLP